MYSSIFQHTSSIADLKSKVSITHFNDLDWVIVDHCLSKAWVYLSAGKDQLDFTYTYENIFNDFLEIILPFTDF